MSFLDNPGIEKIISDVEEFETDKRYDLILCLGILEFLDRPKKFAVKLKTFLKPKGQVVILLPQSRFYAFIYAFYFLLKGIAIHPLSLKDFYAFLIKNDFQLEKKAIASSFSGMAAYSVRSK